MIYYSYYSSPVGDLRMESDGENLTGLYFSECELHASSDLPVFASVRNWLDDYFQGKPHDADFSVRLMGTEFQLLVWNILETVPYGQTATYGQIAREIAFCTGRDKISAQAVGQAVGRNPVSILVPCHRVIGGGRRLTGYAGGLDRKLWLLRHEGWTE